MIASDDVTLNIDVWDELATSKREIIVTVKSFYAVEH